MRNILLILIFISLNSYPINLSKRISSNKLESQIVDSIYWEIFLDSTIIKNSNLDTLFPNSNKVISEAHITIQNCRSVINNGKEYLKYFKKIQEEIHKRKIIAVFIYWDNSDETLLQLFLNSFNNEYLKEIIIDATIHETIKINSLDYIGVNALHISFRTLQSASVSFGTHILKNLPSIEILAIYISAEGKNNHSRKIQLFERQSVKSKVKRLYINVQSYYLIQRLIDSSPLMENIEISFAGKVSLVKCLNLKIVKINSFLIQEYSEMTFNKLCKMLPLQITSLSLPIFLSDNYIPISFTKFKNLEELHIPYIYNIRNPELLLQFKYLKRLSLHSNGRVKYINNNKKHSKIIEDCILKGPNMYCHEYYYFYFSQTTLTPLIDTAIIQKYLGILGGLKLTSLTIDTEYLFLCDTNSLNSIKLIPNLTIRNPKPGFKVQVMGKPGQELLKKQELIWKTLNIPNELMLLY